MDKIEGRIHEFFNFPFQITGNHDIKQVLVAFVWESESMALQGSIHLQGKQTSKVK